VKSRNGTILLSALLSLAGRSEAQLLTAVAEDAAITQAAGDEPLLTPRLLLHRIATDQKPIWMFPVHAAQGKNWKPTLAVVGITAGLIALDPSDTPFFQRASYQKNPAVHGIGNVLSGTSTGLFIAAVPVTFYIAGLIDHDSYSSNTALLAGEAVLDAALVTIVLKDIDRRLTPGQVGPNGSFSDTWFQNPNRSAGGFGSFPSGHTAAAFSVATVFAERYRSHRWVPWIAYGLAGVVGLSRLNVQAHFPSDIFLGAALGYSISHFVVLRKLVTRAP
jgi:membrane-associated phospholipid phosphatase